MPDGQAAGRVEELEVVRVDAELDRLPRPDLATCRNAGHPQRLAADQRGRGLLFVIAGLGRLGEARVLDRWRVDREDHVDLGAELLGDAGGDPHGPPLAVAQAGILEVGGPDAEDDLLADEVRESVLGFHHGGRHRELVTGECDRRAAVTDQFRGDEVHRGRADEAGHEQVHRRLEEILRRVHLLQLPVPQDADAVAERHGLDLVVRHVDGRDAEPLVQLFERAPHGHAQLGVQVGQRLVHQEGLRLADDGPAHRDPLPLAAGQRGRLALEVLLEAEHLGGLVDPALDLILGRLPQLQAERQVLLDRHVRVERVVLEHHGDVPVLRRQVVDHPVADLDRAAGDLLEPGDGPQRGGLAAPGGTDEYHELAVFDVKAQVVNGLDAACVRFFHVLQDDLCHGGSVTSA